MFNGTNYTLILKRQFLMKDPQLIDAPSLSQINQDMKRDETNTRAQQYIQLNTGEK